MNPVEHGEKYDGEYYKGLPAIPEDKAVNIALPCPEIVDHLPTIRDMAARAINILELGPYLGTGSTQAIRQGVDKAPDNCGAWVTVDIVDHIHPWLKPHYDFWKLVIGDSASQATVDMVVAALKLEGGIKEWKVFDLIFIDTVHTYAHLKKELELWSPLASPHCTWLFHDTWMLGQYNPMTDAIKEFAAGNLQWEYADISKKCNGLGALVPV